MKVKEITKEEYERICKEAEQYNLEDPCENCPLGRNTKYCIGIKLNKKSIYKDEDLSEEYLNSEVEE